VRWDGKLLQWLVIVLVDNLERQSLCIFMDLFRHLYQQIPALMDKCGLTNLNASERFRHNNDVLQAITRPLYDTQITAPVSLEACPRGSRSRRFARSNSGQFLANNRSAFRFRLVLIRRPRRVSFVAARRGWAAGVCPVPWRYTVGQPLVDAEAGGNGVLRVAGPPPRQGPHAQVIAVCNLVPAGPRRVAQGRCMARPARVHESSSRAFLCVACHAVGCCVAFQEHVYARAVQVRKQHPGQHIVLVGHMTGARVAYEVLLSPLRVVWACDLLDCFGCGLRPIL
jgi:hypothetical protein